LRRHPFGIDTRKFLLLCSLLLPALLTGCGGSSGGGEKTLTTIAVGPATISVARAAALQLTATGTYSDGTTADLTATSTWATATPSVATVSAAGLLTAVAAGTSSVTATSSGVTGTKVATVTDRVITSVAVTPATADAIAGGAPVALTARATFADSTTADVTSQATWTTSLAGQVDVSAGAATAPAAALVSNVATISAAYGGQEGRAVVRVVRGAPLEPSAFRDPLFPQQWHLLNSGQKAFADVAGLPDEDLRLSSAWQLGITGAVKVAILDDGLERNHPDLFGNMVPGSWNFSTKTNDPTPTRINQSHGTSVAGITAMIYGNGKGGMGVAPGAKLNGYVLIEVPNPADVTSQSFVAALGAYDPAFPDNPKSDDVSVFNQSYGRCGQWFAVVDKDVAKQFRAGVTSLRTGKGGIYVKAAGNDFFRIVGVDKSYCARANALPVSCGNPSQDGEAALPENIVVGSLGANGKRAAYSTAGSALWVSAPGGGGGGNKEIAPGYVDWVYEAAMVTTDQLTCDRGASRTKLDPDNPDDTLPVSTFDRGSVPDGNGSCDYRNGMSGTSSAAPNTSGAVALLLDANPALTWRDVKHVLARSARKVDAGIAIVPLSLPDGTYVAEQAWVTNAAGYPFHNWYGFGAVDVSRALELARSHVPGSLGTWKIVGPLSSAVGPPQNIPDFRLTGATSRINVPGTAITRVEAIVVSVDVLHPNPSDLGIELTNPAGTTRSILLNVGNALLPLRDENQALQVLTATIETNAFYDELAAGEWTLKVVDAYDGQSGTLNGWTITVYGH